MIEYKIIWSDSAVTFVKKLDKTVAIRIYKKVDEIKSDPFRYVIKLVGSDLFRLRIGDYRVLIDIQQNVLEILIVHVGHRKNIYD